MLKDSKAPSPLNQRAESDLRLIRNMMQRSVRFVPLPGWGIVMVGMVGAVSGWMAGNQIDSNWIRTWLVGATVAMLVSVVTAIWQFKRSGRSVFTGSGRRFWLSLLPGFVSAVLLTVALTQIDQLALLPGLWLLLYGVAIVAAGEHSVPPVAWMGYAFSGLGAVALFVPWPNLFMVLGFGGLHLVFGLIIMKSHPEVKS